MKNVDYKNLTPMMKQYYDIKIENMDSILMFRLGDFYEMFFDDAEIASKELDIVLTARGSKSKNKIPMCGIPYHSADNYINRLINRGYKVAICEQLEDPEAAEGIVERGIVRVITPGTNLQIDTENDKNNFLGSVYSNEDSFSLSYVDFSTGDLYISYRKEDYTKANSVLKNQLSFLQISELILDKDYDIDHIINTNNILVNSSSDYSNMGKDFDQFLNNLDYLDITLDDVLSNEVIVGSLKNLYNYLEATQFGAISHIIRIKYINFDEYMILDRHTLYSLDIFSESRVNEGGTLLKLLNKTRTAMGSRKLRYILEHPLVDPYHISNRLDIIEKFLFDLNRLDKVRSILYNIYDLERIMVKISGPSNSPKDLRQLANSLENLPEIYELLSQLNIKSVENIQCTLDKEVEDVYDLINMSITDDPPISYRDGGIIQEKYSKKLDDLKSTSIDSKTWLLEYEKKLKEETGINNLRIKHNKILGYFIEVTKGNIDRVPDYFIRKQTLVGSERYFTEKLKSTEVKITSSKDILNTLEEELYFEIRDKILDSYNSIIDLAEFISYVDVFSTLAYVSHKNNYTKPSVSKDGNLNIVDGRHPIVEKSEEIFITNDTIISNDKNFIILTGPNMAGKSTYMRQIALISIMMQIGSYVPAREAQIPVFDRIFTRIGAHDDLYMGDSTFMVEMKEMADIIDNATDNSLIILDEVGRGTSTYDGLSLAKSIIEYIVENLSSKTIFATHYHELIQLEEYFPNIKNQTMAVRERDGNIQFLRKVIDGASDRSYGIHVATLAGIKEEIVDRAYIYLKEYEEKSDSGQLQMFNLVAEPTETLEIAPVNKEIDNDILEELKNYVNNMDINQLTPLESLIELKKIKDKINEKN